MGLVDTTMPATFRDMFQLAFVTRDVERAAAIMTQRHALTPFSVHDISIPCKGREDPCVARVAISWNGERQIELIEPVAGAVELYRNGLPAGDAVAAFHHVGIKVRGTLADWEERRAELVGRGMTIALEGGLEDRVRFAYFDARATLGHYMELIWLGAPFLTAQAAAWPP
jgi:hypothetical protein